MSAPTTLSTWNDVINWALRKADEPSDYLASNPAAATSDFADAAVTAGVDVWRDLCGRHPWLCFRKEPQGAFVTFQNDLTQTLTVPSTGVNVVCTLGAGYTVTGFSSLVGAKVRVPGSATYAKVTAHVNGQAQITLDAVNFDMVGAARPIEIYMDEYNLASDLGVFVNGIWTVFGYECYLWPEERIRTEYPSPMAAASWPPRAFARIGRTRIRFASYPTQAYRMEYPYCFEPADPIVTDPTGTAALVMEPRMIPIFAIGVTGIVRGLKSDSRAQGDMQVFEAKVQEHWEYESRRLRAWQSRYGNTTVKGPYS